MNLIKHDFDFLGDFTSTINEYRERITREIEANQFSKHPKRIVSDSQCSLLSTTRTTTAKFSSQPTINRQYVERVQQQVNVPPLEIEPIGDRDEKVISRATTKRTNSSKVKKNKRIISAGLTDKEFDKKFKIYVERSLKLLKEISLCFAEDKINEPDGDEDYDRRLKRVQEFSIRFSRIYLYPLGQLTNELSLPMKLLPTIINQKLLNCCQIIIQSLQAYLNHLPTTIGDCLYEKFKLLLEQIIYICQLFGILKPTKKDYEKLEYIDALRSSVETVVEEISKYQIKKQEMIKLKTIKKKNVNENKIKKKLNRFAMYESRNYRAANAKFNVKSRYKTATLKHRPQVEKSNIPPLSKHKQIHQRYSDSTIKNTTPITTPVREDDIKTVVEYDNGITKPLNHEDVSDKILQLVQNGSGGNECGKVDDVRNALEILKNHFNIDYNEILLKITEKQPENNCKQFVFIENIDGDGLKPTKTRKEPVITAVTGTKNAKLICIRDDNSVIEDKDDVVDGKEKPVISSCTQTDLNHNEPKKKSTMKRLPQPQRSLQTLPKDYVSNVIKYKLDHYMDCKKNPMYKKSSKPWLLVGKMSDDLLDELLHSVINEMEMKINEIVENVYKSEFQL